MMKPIAGEWAIVTGASSGIGKEFAYQLAASGYNLLIVSRRENLLQELAEEISAQFTVSVKYLAIDLTSEDILDELERETARLPIGLVISNAGAARMGLFHKLPLIDFEHMIRLNISAHMKITHWYINRQIAQQKKGALILVSSTTAFQGVPYAADYAAAKAYLLNLGEALNYEYQDKGIRITVLVPGPTDTPGIRENQDADMISHLPMKPQSVGALVSEGLDAIYRNKPYHIGGRMNRVMFSVMKSTMSRKGTSRFWGKMMYKMVNEK